MGRKLFISMVLIVGFTSILLFMGIGKTFVADITGNNGCLGSPWQCLQSLPRQVRDGAQSLLSAVSSDSAADDAIQGQLDAEGTGGNFYRSVYNEIRQKPLESFLDELAFETGVKLSPTDVKGFEDVGSFFDLLSVAKDLRKPRYQLEFSGISQDQCLSAFGMEVESKRRQASLLRKRLEAKIAAEPSLLGGISSADYFVHFDAEMVPAPVSASVLKAEAETTNGFLRCIHLFGEEAHFQSDLALLFEPLRKKIQIFGTFVNGRLDDFEGGESEATKALARAGLADIGLPKFDLVFDLEVLEKLLFGSNVFISTGSGVPENARGSASGAGGGNNDALLGGIASGGADSVPNFGFGYGGVPSTTSVVPGVTTSGGVSGVSTTTGRSGGATFSVGITGALFDSLPEGADAMCPYDQTLSLDFGGISEHGVYVVPLAPEASIPSQGLVPEDLRNVPVGGVQEAVSSVGDALADFFRDSGVDPEDASVNDLSQIAAEQSGGECELSDQSDYFSYLFCIWVKFQKTGKTWQVEKEDDSCIACQIRKLNQIFEEYTFTESIRPHKNSGMIMESGICNDAYGDDVGFFVDIQWVPVQFYDAICYPSAGMYGKAMGSIKGYPSLLRTVSLPTGESKCSEDPEIKNDAEVLALCQKILGSDIYTHEQYVADYLGKKDRWRKLVGEQGLAQRELHEFLVRLGDEQPIFGEKDALLRDGKDFFVRRKKLMDALAEHRHDPMKVLCLKGVVGGYDGCDLVDPPDSMRKLTEEVDDERARIDKLLGTWKKMKSDFEQEHSCSEFENKGPLDTLKSFLGDKFPDESVKEPKETYRTRVLLDNVRVGTLKHFYEEFEKFAEQEEQIVTANADRQEVELKQLLFSQQMTVLSREIETMQQYLKTFNDQFQRLDEQKFLLGTEKKSVLEMFLEKIKPW